MRRKQAQHEEQKEDEVNKKARKVATPEVSEAASGYAGVTKTGQDKDNGQEAIQVCRGSC